MDRSSSARRSPTLFKGVTKEEFGKALTDNFLPTDSVRLEQNALVINTGDKLVLIDTGTGGQKLFGPHSGKLLANLKAAGIDPKDIDAVALTHAHPDHCWGLLDENGAKNFPNAQVYMSEDDFKFWTDASNAPNDMIKGFIEGTTKQLLPIRERIEFVKDGQEFITGIQAISAPGHTVGHTAFMITSQGKQLCNTGDLAHHHVVSLRSRSSNSPSTPTASAAPRPASRCSACWPRSAFRLCRYHFPWPGVGNLAKQGDGFRYYPSPIQTAL